MLVKNNIAQPGEIKSIDLQPTHIEVRKRTGEVMVYTRKESRPEPATRVLINDPKRGSDE